MIFTWLVLAALALSVALVLGPQIARLLEGAG